ncbi:MAG: antifreeze protein [Gammaproteobacteria bacterium]|nr:MAG: antifreeze protein [Gammaproteobacteria bacterium]
MGIFNLFHGEFVDIIEWTQMNSDTMVYRFPRYKNEIKYGAKLTVREGQTAILVNEGKIADVFPAGIYELKTANLPILSTLQNWQHGFESPFKAEVYFFNTTQFLNQKWGTKQAVTLLDKQFGVVRLRAFGSYTLGVKEPKLLLKKLVGSDGNFEINEVNHQLTNSIVAHFPNILAESRTGVLQLPTRYNELAHRLKQKVKPEFDEYGLQLGKLYIENISLPEAVQKTIDEQTGMNIIGDNINNYAKYQTAKGMANNGEGSQMASAGVGMAMGMEMAKSMAADRHEEEVPPPAPLVYYLMLSGKRKGPMTLDKVMHYLKRGEASADTLIWRKGMPGWKTIGELDEIDLTQFPLPIEPS